MTDQATRWISLSDISADPRCQPRAEIDAAAVGEYADEMTAGVIFPNVDVFFDGTTNWLADGFHRFYAAKRAGLRQINATSTPGDLWDAIERSCIVNGEHGLRRSNADKRRAVEAMFAVMEYRGESWSNQEIARRCAVDPKTVTAVRSVISWKFQEDASTRLIERGGRRFEMNTANIGRAVQRVPVETSWATFDNGRIGEPRAVHEVSPEVQNQLVSFEVAIARKRIVGQTVADCTGRLAKSRGELGELVKDLGAEEVRQQVERDGTLAREWAQLIDIAGEVMRFAAGVVAVEVEQAR